VRKQLAATEFMKGNLVGGRKEFEETIKRVKHLQEADWLIENIELGWAGSEFSRNQFEEARMHYERSFAHALLLPSGPGTNANIAQIVSALRQAAVGRFISRDFETGRKFFTQALIKEEENAKLDALFANSSNLDVHLNWCVAELMFHNRKEAEAHLEEAKKIFESIPLPAPNIEKVRMEIARIQQQIKPVPLPPLGGPMFGVPPMGVAPIHSPMPVAPAIGVSQ
jgi:hypothetical protein